MSHTALWSDDPALHAFLADIKAACLKHGMLLVPDGFDAEDGDTPGLTVRNYDEKTMDSALTDAVDGRG